MTSKANEEDAHTPGPWAWFGNAKNNEVYLATVDRGRRYVMGFERWGMRGAQPRFQPGGRGLVSASELLAFEVGDRSVRGVDAAKADESVYRLDIRDIDCPDARLIAEAPNLLKELERVLDWAVVEKAPLRAQEIASISDAIARATTLPQPMIGDEA